jgi:hypothetical protein
MLEQSPGPAVGDFARFAAEHFDEIVRVAASPWGRRLGAHMARLAEAEARLERAYVRRGVTPAEARMLVEHARNRARVHPRFTMLEAVTDAYTALVTREPLPPEPPDA